MTARVWMLLKSGASLTCFRACFLRGRAKYLSALCEYRTLLQSVTRISLLAQDILLLDADWSALLLIIQPNYYRIFRDVKLYANPRERAVKDVGVRPLACLKYGFESHRVHGCLL